MRIGLVGLGRMGGNMARRLQAAGHECVVYDASPAAGRLAPPAGSSPTALSASVLQ